MGNERRIAEAYSILNKLELDETQEANKRIWCLFNTNQTYEECEDLRHKGLLKGTCPYYTNSLSMLKVLRGTDWWYKLSSDGHGIANCTMGCLPEGEPLQAGSGSQASEEMAMLIAILKLQILIWRGEDEVIAPKVDITALRKAVKDTDEYAIGQVDCSIEGFGAAKLLLETLE